MEHLINYKKYYLGFILILFLFNFSFTLKAIDRVATFPVIEKTSADNGLAFNPIQPGSSRAYGGLSTSSPSITFMSSSTYTNRSYNGLRTAFLLGYDTKLENGYIGGRYLMLNPQRTTHIITVATDIIMNIKQS